MISDVLSEAVDDVNSYLNWPDSPYTGSLRLRIETLRDAMDAMRAELDAPPSLSPSMSRVQELDSRAHLIVSDEAIAAAYLDRQRRVGWWAA